MWNKLKFLSNFKSDFRAFNASSVYQSNSTKKLEKLLNKGEKYFLNIRFNENGNFGLLHQSIYDKNQNVFETIINHQIAESTAVIEDNNNNFKLTPLQMAVVFKNREACDKLLKVADYTVLTEDGLSLAHLSAHSGDPVIMERFAEKGVTPTSTAGWTPLHYACLMDRIDAASVILENKPNLYARNEEGNTPIDLAALNDNLVLFKILYEHFYDLNRLYSNESEEIF